MAYEKEAVAPSTSAVASQPQVIREPVEIDPRARSRQPALAPESTGQVDKGGTTQAVETKPAEETVTLSPQMAALARKEQKNRQREQELKKQEEALVSERAEIADLKAMKARLAAKDYSGIESQVDYEAYTQYLLAKQNGTNPDQEALKKLEAKVEGVEKANTDFINKQFESAVNERRQAVTKLVEVDPTYASIKELKMQEAVVHHILDTWETDSKELSVEDAAKEVEEILLETANKWASLSKLKKTEATDEKKPLPPLKQGLKTLTNQVTASEFKSTVKSLQNLSDGERWAEARRRAEEKLKQQTRG